jgi:hypothetical protein
LPVGNFLINIFFIYEPKRQYVIGQQQARDGNTKARDGNTSSYDRSTRPIRSAASFYRDI